MLIEERISCPHTVRCLHAAGITTMEQLSAYTHEDLIKLRGIGKVIAEDVTSVIQNYQKNLHSNQL